MSDPKNPSNPYDAEKAKFIRDILMEIVGGRCEPDGPDPIAADLDMAEMYYAEMVKRGYIRPTNEFWGESTPSGVDELWWQSLGGRGLSVTFKDPEKTTPCEFKFDPEPPKSPETTYPASRIANQVSQIKGLNEKNRKLQQHIQSLQYTLSKRNERIQELFGLMAARDRAISDKDALLDTAVQLKLKAQEERDELQRRVSELEQSGKPQDPTDAELIAWLFANSAKGFWPYLSFRFQAQIFKYYPVDGSAPIDLDSVPTLNAPARAFALRAWKERKDTK